jgi:hypothetical protein
MSRYDRLAEEAERRVDCMTAADLRPWQVKFAEDREGEFFDWLREQVLKDVRTDASESHPDFILYIGRGA